ncbi:hypothetical protein BVY00_02125 [bacterium G20]|nr:hypothetical protein BVY00_02125 [bacterium G20]
MKLVRSCFITELFERSGDPGRRQGPRRRAASWSAGRAGVLAGVVVEYEYTTAGRIGGLAAQGRIAHMRHLLFRWPLQGLLEMSEKHPAKMLIAHLGAKVSAC